MLAGTQDTLAPSKPTVVSHSKPISAWSVFVATLVKDLQIEWRYLPNLISKGVELGIRVLFYFVLSGVIALKASETPITQDITDLELFIFFQGALLLFVFNGIALNTPVQSVMRDLSNGTLEFLYSNPSSRYAYYVGGIVANAIISMIIFIPLYLFLVVSSSASFIEMLLVLAVCGAVLITLIAMGVMIALLGILWRQVAAITQVLAIMFEMLSGAYFPITAFPPFFQYVSYLLPYTWGYDLIRYYSFSGQWETILPIWMEWLILGVYAIIYTVLSIYLLRLTERHAKKKGLHLL